MTDRAILISRRNAAAGLLAFGGLLVLGCGRPESPGADDPRPPAEPAAVPLAAAMTVYRDPGCGCYEEWAERAREAGFKVAVTNNSDMAAVKRRHGVPEDLASCHTTLVGGYILEGHVPLDDVKRLLKDRPAGIRGIAVAGMPRGSPGMEMPDGSKDPFQVMAFDGAGRISVFSA
jgi:hypothetical protein